MADGTFEKIGGWIKEHPAILIGGVIVIGLGVFLLLAGGGGGGGAVAASGADPNSAAELALAQQTESDNAQLGLATIQGNNALALAKENNAAQITLAGTAAGIATLTANNNYNLGLAQVNANLAGLENNNQTSVAIANIAANQNESLANTNAALQSHISDNTTGLQALISNNQTNVAIHQIDANQTSSLFGGVLGFLGAIL